MTKKELIELLRNAPDDAEAYFYNNADNRFYIVDIAYFDGKDIVLDEQLP